jgi:hypothetical protein
MAISLGTWLDAVISDARAFSGQKLGDDVCMLAVELAAG